MQLFRYLNHGLAAILVFVGAKMSLVYIYKMPVTASLGIVAGILALSVLASLLRPAPQPAPPQGEHDHAGSR